MRVSTKEQKAHGYKLRRKWLKENRERTLALRRANRKPEPQVKRSERVRLWRARHPERYQAHRAVQEALRKGVLRKPDGCELCGFTGRLEADHRDYSEPLNVRWLCYWCHHGVPKQRHVVPLRPETPKLSKSEYAHRRAAGSVLCAAVYDGRVIKPSTCQSCGSDVPKPILHGHHEDYSKPLEVIWLCPPCHGRIERNNKGRKKHCVKF